MCEVSAETCVNFCAVKLTLELYALLLQLNEMTALLQFHLICLSSKVVQTLIKVTDDKLLVTGR